MADTPTILITGGTGFAGSHLVEALLAAGHDPNQIHVTSYGGSSEFLASLLPTDNIHGLNLTDHQATAELFSRITPDQIFQLASIAKVGQSFDEADEIVTNNASLQISVLKAMRDHAPEAKMLSIHSADAYAQSDLPLTEISPIKPANPYGVSKYTQEMLVDVFIDAYDLNIVKVRPFNHIGERQAAAFVISAFAQQIAQIEAGNQDKLKVGNLEATRDFTDVKDMVQAYLLLMAKGETGQVYNAGSGQGRTITDMLKLLTDLSTQEIAVEPDPSRMRPVDVPYIVADVSRLKALGWQPTIPVTDTLQRTLEYWRFHQ